MTIITLMFTMIPIIGLIIIIVFIKEAIFKNETDEIVADASGTLVAAIMALIFGGLVCTLLWGLTIMSWESHIDEIRHPCIEWSNPYATGGLADESFCRKRKD